MASILSLIAQPIAPDIAGAFEQGRAQARQIERERLMDQELRAKLDRENRFRELAGRAYGATSPIEREQTISQAAAIDPQGAAQLGQSLGSFEERRKQRLGLMASALTNSPEQLRPLIYRSMVPELRQLGLQPPDEYTPEIDALAQQLAAVLAGEGAPAELRTFQAMTQGMSPEDIERARRVALGIEGRATSAGMSMQKITGPDGREYAVVFDPRTGQPRPVLMEELFEGGPAPVPQTPTAPPAAPPAPPPANALATTAPTVPPVPSAAPATPPVSAPRTPVASPTPEERKRLEALGTERGRQQAEADPLPGSKEFRERRKAEITGRQILRRAEEQLGTIDRVASSLMDRAGMWTAGFLGSALARIPGTPAHDFARDLETLKAVIGFDELQQMRDASPTGGALGQVTEMEHRLLQSAWASLEQSQSPDQFRRNMQIVIDRARRAWRNVREAYEEEFGRPMAQQPQPGLAQSGATPGEPVRVNSPQELDALPSGARFIAPDGSVRVKP